MKRHDALLELRFNTLPITNGCPVFSVGYQQFIELNIVQTDKFMHFKINI